MFPRSGARADAALRYHCLLKTLLVDIDGALLRHCLARVGGRQPLAVASSKAQSIELLRHGPPVDVVVVCERLEDGSGLALLDEVHARWPHLIRVFCAERQRLVLLRTRLSALRLRHTLLYPFKPIKLEQMLVHLGQTRGNPTARMRRPVRPEG
jgi:ActR/RegA family two-component response regulator